MSESPTNLSAERPSAAVERLSVEAVPERPRRPKLVEAPPVGLSEAISEQTPPAFDPAPIYAEVRRLHALVAQRRSSIPDQINAVFTAIARVLAVRLLLLLSLIGAFVLALGAMRSQDWPGLAVLVAFAVLTVLPLVWLEFSARPRA